MVRAVDLIYQIVKDIYDAKDISYVSERDAMQHVVRIIRQTKFGETRYFWILDKKPSMVIHPVYPELSEKQLADFTNPEGRRVFVEMVSLVQNKGEGFIEYEWLEQKERRPVKKLSYLKSFEPWGWIIGTDINLEEVNSYVKSIAMRISLYGLIVFSVICGIAYFVTESARKTLRLCGPISQKLSKIAEGDLCVVFEKEGTGEIGVIEGSAKKLLESLKDMASGILNTARAAEETVKGVNRSSDMLVLSLQDHSKRLNEIASSADQITQTITEIAKNVSKTSDKVRSTVDFLRQGQVNADEMVKAVEKAEKITEDLSRNIEVLEANVRDIEGILSVIEEITDQTELLSLNAAIEAARAGEFGRGFAVVAQEVKDLSNRASLSTQEIGKIIGDSTRGFSMLKGSIKDAVDSMKRTSALIRDMYDVFSKISSSTQEVFDLISLLSAATEEQSVTVRQIAKNIEEISSIAEYLKTVYVQELAGGIQRLYDSILDLKKEAERFKLSS
ncbi:MAG: methyl-accepting chemotaxis protein [Desulfobacterota bacterium]|nr:methyl-accepting chemotaxis protein [Thermodesulfobacteriota bacterium]MDW8002823.1 methyl-accepting chemotaxis protein [Deltaproteobacteria bacterium]